MKKISLLLLAWSLIIMPLKAQDSVLDYSSSASAASVIYHGKEQVQYLFSIRNHPYFMSEDYTIGELSYDGVFYKDVSMRYDMYRGELLLRTPDNRFNIVLPGDRFSYANIYGYHLVYIDPDGAEGGMPKGYYMMLHNGEVDVLAFASCRMNHEVKGMEHIDYFEKSIKYYVRADGKCYHVRGKRSLLAILKSRKSDLSRYIKSEKLNFRSSLEQSVVKVVMRYEQLNRGL